ncbi:EamA family transporter [Bordetella genomosp. 10]|uniref:EamA family transporter n=1 Tax=Bordetella genomosp. 10 TaxID=1416804 RepID=A0A261S4G8_9BORD|nr:DMT family transporter [Bordetella genomosp. 10]OZI32051.1 EamA family transporter [Bordetella genomosp. 10]
MRSRDITDLLVLAAVWGGSFLFMRIGVPEFGPAALIALRVGLAALALLPLLFWQHKTRVLLRHWKAIFVVGTFNATLPFILYAYAAQQLGAGFLSIANAVTPMWGAAIGWIWLGDRLPASRVAGMALGLAGIVVLVWDKFNFGADGSGLAVLAALLAPVCYGISANCAKRYLFGVDPLTNATGSMLASALTLLPFAIWTWPAQPVSFHAWSATLLLALACTGLAYVLFFRLIANVGPIGAISVTFLVPIFGVFWGAFFLNEIVTSNMLAGAAVVLAGTALALGLVRLPVLR